MSPLTVTRQGACLTPTVPPPPTPTGTAPPSTATATATAVATPTWEPRPTATATRAVRPAFLPVALREECVPKTRKVDVALVLDASTSMLEEVEGGGTKLEAATAAVRVFLGELALGGGGDQAAIVTFSAEAAVVQELTADREALERALGRIETAGKTRIHLGIEAATGELASGRHAAGSGRAMVVLTDGRANPDSPELAVAEAGEAKAAQVTVFTIGLGNELDNDALGRMASKREYYYRAPTAGDLEGIYREVAVTIPCPAESFWGRR